MLCIHRVLFNNKCGMCTFFSFMKEQEKSDLFISCLTGLMVRTLE